MINKKRTHIVISEELAAAIDSTVGKRARSRFFSEVAWREIKRRRLLKALDRAAGSWKDDDHPELKHGAARWVSKLREESEGRFRRVTKRR